jgi:hypothetical protein
MDGVSKQYDNPYLRAYLEKARATGSALRIYTADPMRVVSEGVDSGDSPTPWVYGHHVDTFTTTTPDGAIHIPPSGAWIKYFGSNDNLDPDYWRYGSYAEFPGGQFTFVRIDGNGDSYGWGGRTESNSAFWGGFIRGAVVWAVVVGSIVYTAGVVSDYGVIGAVEASPLVGPVEVTPALLEAAPALLEAAPAIVEVAPALLEAAPAIVEVAPALVGPVEVVGSGFQFADVISGAKTVVSDAKTAVGIISAVKTAVASVQNAVSGSGDNSPPPDPAPAPTGDNAMMYAAIAGVLLLIL